jgi:hypothetical protein
MSPNLSDPDRRLQELEAALQSVLGILLPPAAGSQALQAAVRGLRARGRDGTTAQRADESAADRS